MDLPFLLGGPKGKCSVVISEFRASEISGTQAIFRHPWVPALRFASAGMTNRGFDLNLKDFSTCRAN